MDFTDDDSFDEVERVIHTLVQKYPEKFIPSAAKRRPLKRRRHVYGNLWDSEWGRLLAHSRTRKVGTFEYKKFRIRFRVPFPVFEDVLIPAIRSEGIFNPVRDSRIPLEFKVMIALRMLARDTDSDTASELSGVPKSTCNAIFNEFCVRFVDKFYESFVSFPDIGSDTLKKIMETFSKVGFPGALGSMDVTHFRWASCPKQSTNLCKGKYPYPSLACQAIVDRNRKILFMSDLYDGRENDKTITINTPFTYEIMHKGKFNEVEFNLYDEDGVSRVCKGGYIIVDGGYQKLPCFVDPLHCANGHKEVHWSEFLESVRKDVECVFGILKSRFHILRNGLRHKRPVCTAIVKTCAILHNMLLVYDGLDEFSWNDGEAGRSDHATADGDIYTDCNDPNMTDDSICFHHPDRSGDSVLTDRPMLPDEVPEESQQTGFHFQVTNRNHYGTIHKWLVNHFYHQWRYGQLQWPRRFCTSSKAQHPMARVAERVRAEIPANHELLYSEPIT